VVCGLSETIATFSPTIALTSVDLPALGRPARATKPLRVASAIGQHPALELEHLAAVGLVIHPRQVQRAVHDRLAQVCRVLGADDHVAQLARPGGGAGGVDREREHVGGGVAAAVLAVERTDALGVDELDGDVPVLDAGGGQGAGARLARGGGVQPPARVLDPDDLDLDQGCARRRSAERSSGIARSACSP
jgi:hypothetical protein